MKLRGREGSLGRRLLVALALLAAVGMGLLSMAVYKTTEMGLVSRQDDLLHEKQLLVQYLLEDQQLRSDSAALKSRLDDVFFGYKTLWLELRTADDRSVYRNSAPAPKDNVRLREVKREFMPMVGQSATTRASFMLNVHADDEVLRRLSTTLVSGTLIGVALMSLCGMLVARYSLAPIQVLVEQTRDVEPDSLHKRLDVSGQPDELRPLVEQFNALLDRQARAFQQLRSFNADVAHELRTPLATLTVGNELALRGQRTPAELLDTLGSNLEELNRLSAIVNDMLFLSHADQGERARRRGVSSLATLAREVVAFHEAELHERGLAAAVSGDASGAVDGPLLQRALSNILGNAVRYARQDSSILIVVGQTPGDPGRFSLMVQNEGDTIDPEHLPRLFERFYRAESSRSHSHRNHGLGLAIVEAIARMHDGVPFAHSEHGVTKIGLRGALS